MRLKSDQLNTYSETDTLKATTVAVLNMATKHFVLTNDDRLEEFSDEEAARVANGSDLLPQFAETRVRYVQVAFDDDTNENGEIKVYTMGAVVGFDTDGRLSETGSEEENQQPLSEFEQEACVEFALHNAGAQEYRLN